MLKNNDSRLSFPSFFVGFFSFLVPWHAANALGSTDLSLRSPSSEEMWKCRVSLRLALARSLGCSRTLQQSRCSLSWGSGPDLLHEGRSLLIPFAVVQPPGSSSSSSSGQTHAHVLRMTRGNTRNSLSWIWAVWSSWMFFKSLKRPRLSSRLEH